MFEDDDLDLDFGDSLLEPMAMLKSNPTFKPKIASHTTLRTSNQPYPTHPPKKPPSITQLSTPDIALSVQPSKLLPKPRLDHQIVTSSPKPSTRHLVTPSPTPFPSHLLQQPGPPLVRRFPGPAGLMPKLSPGLHKTSFEGEREDQQQREQEEEDEMECEGVEDCVAWRRARQELGMIDKNSLVEKFNTRWIKDKSQTGSTKKMPFFLCKIGKLDLTSVDPLVMLMDREGRVEGSMHRDVVDQFGKEVRVGSVLVLQRVAVLVTARREYVNITLNNLVSIYTLPPPCLVCAPLSPMLKPTLKQPIFQSNSPQTPTLPPPPLLPSNNFTLKCHPPPPTSQLPSQAQSQHLVASLLSDLDTSDIWSDS